MPDISHTIAEVLKDELASRTFDLTTDERASIIVALRLISKDMQALSDRTDTPSIKKKHADFFIEQARGVIEKLGLFSGM
jgi:hypothetical protein